MPYIKRSQAGFALLDVTIAVAVMAVVSIYGIYPKVQELRLRKAENQVVQAMVVSNAVATFMTTRYGNLVAGTAIAGVVNPYAPTIAELNKLGLLANFPGSNLYGGGYAISITLEPAGCVAPNCDLASWTSLTTPITNSLTGRVDGDALGQAATAIGANAGFSRTITPTTIKGVNGSWSRPNPQGSTAGILMIRAGYGSSGLAQFMRRDGTLPATGAQDMGGQDVNNVATLRSTSIANTGTATIYGALGVAGTTYTNGLTNNGAITTNSATISALTAGTAKVMGELSASSVSAGSANIVGALTANSATVSGAMTAGSATVNGAMTAGSATVNGTANLNGTTNVGGALRVVGATTLNSTLAVAGETIASGITNNGVLTNTGDIKAPRVYLTTIVQAGSVCAGFSGYQATTSTGQIASCVNGVWDAYTSTPPPSACNSTPVDFQGCSGTLPYTQSGTTADVTMTAGTGRATYSCQNGSWGFQSGSCTPPPKGCGAQSVSWSGSASCNGTTKALASGATQWVNSSNYNTGQVYVTCKEGILSQTSPSCSTPTTTFYGPLATNGSVLAYNPSSAVTFCQSKGYSSVASYTQQDQGGMNQPVCWSIDGNRNCTGGGNCSTMAYGNPGCYVATSISCS